MPPKFKMSATKRNLGEGLGAAAEEILKPDDAPQALPDLGPEEAEDEALVREKEEEEEADKGPGDGATPEMIMGEVMQRLTNQRDITRTQLQTERQLVDFVEEVLSGASAGGVQTESLRALQAQSAHVLGATFQARKSLRCSIVGGAGASIQLRKKVVIAGFGPDSGSALVLYNLQPYLGCDQEAEVNEQTCEYKELTLTIRECRGDSRLFSPNRINDLCADAELLIFVVRNAEVVNGVQDEEGSTLSTNMAEELQRWLACTALEGKPVCILGYQGEDDEVPEGLEDDAIAEAVGLHFLWARNAFLMQMRAAEKRTATDRLKAWLHRTLVVQAYASPWQLAKLEGEQSMVLESQSRVLALLADLRTMMVEEKKSKTAVESAKNAAAEEKAAAERARAEKAAAEKAADEQVRAEAEEAERKDREVEEAAAKKKETKKEMKTFEVLKTRPKFGSGRENLPDGSYYEGQFRNYKRDGQGKLVMSEDGLECFEGQFAREFMDGNGVRRWRDGSTYTGQWAAGRKDGDGRFVDVTAGRTYEGSWKDGRRHGRGFQSFENGDRYDGRWVNGMQHGSGRYYFAVDGSVFEGHWQNGAYHGLGLRTLKDGNKERLEYDKGVLVSQEVLRSARDIAMAKQNVSSAWGSGTDLESKFSDLSIGFEKEPFLDRESTGAAAMAFAGVRSSLTG